MQRKTWGAVAAVGVVAAIAIPTIAFGNARNNNGNQNFFQKAQTPYIARLLGTNESPTGDPDGAGTAAITFDIVDGTALGAEVCWDLNYTGILAPPIQAHIHAGGPGVNGVIIVPFSNLGASS
ncbi:MAG TPA: CHRD domain-containing protein, partial [Ilumatobacteraceae bacterium]